jgi:hypothetical protein
MKIYCLLLAVLFLSSTITRLLQLTVETDLLLSIKLLLDIVLFALCLLACFGLAFGRHFFSLAFWAWPGRLTLLMGGVHVMLTLSRLNEHASPYWPIDLGMACLIYGLFAIPAILYANEMKTPASAKQSS